MFLPLKFYLKKRPKNRHLERAASIDKVVEQLRYEGDSIDDKDLKYIWQTRHAHINVYGQYHFDKKRLRKRHPLRDLRNPDS
jgi:hypothetical protein